MSAQEYRNSLMESIKKTEANIRAWKKVRRVTKEDGSDYELFPRNFSKDSALEIVDHAEGYVDFTVYADDEKEGPVSNMLRVQKENGILTPDKAMAAIEDYIDRLGKMNDLWRQRIQMSDEEYNEAMAGLSKLTSNLPS